MQRTHSGLLLPVSALVLSAALLAAQDAPPAFEVASVRPNNSGEGFVRFGRQPGGRFTATNVPLRELIRFAYQVQPFQIEGAPGWAASERFDIVAKAEGDPPLSLPGGPPDAMALMMRTLLAERFKLKLHNETRDLPVYALLPARADRKPGPKLAASTVDCAAVMAARGRAGGPPPPMPQFGERMQCGFRIGPGTLSAGSASMTQLANGLSPMVGRQVVDQTGWSGNFDFDLTWTPDQMPQRAPGTPADQPVRINGIDIDPNGPSIFTAVQEQLGLKLDSTRGPVQVLVIDSVERPTPD
jgi:uncharacterized protein (TIGR03435 family)